MAAVSKMTVSRVINGHHSVRPETRNKILRAIKRLNFVPNRSAQSLASSGRIRIGFLYTNPSAGYLSEFLCGSLDQAGKTHIQLVVQRSGPDGNATDAVTRLIQSGVDGLILLPPLCDCDAVIDHIIAHGLPVIAVATARMADKFSVISIDDYRAAREMTDYILSLGHRDVGFITGDLNLSASERRLAGFRDALSAAGIPFRQEFLFEGSFTYRSGLDAAEELLGRMRVPTAIFASNDDMAAAVIAVAYRRGLSVPRDLTICGYDDTTLATVVWPELTTIRQPVADMARAAVELLASEIKRARKGESSAPQHIVQSFRLVERHSSAPPNRSMTRRSGCDLSI